MRIGGYIPSSLIDFPGQVSAVVFTIGCNFRCPYCHNPELVLETPEREYSEAEIFEFLRSRAGILPAVTITGGEPTMHADLPEFMAAARALGFLVKLDTNGTNPRMLADVIERGLVDYVAMDIKAPFDRYAQVVGSTVNIGSIKESISILLRGSVEYEFRTTVVKSQLSLHDLETIGGQIAGAQRYYLQQFNPAKTLHPVFRRKLSYAKEELEGAARAIEHYVDACKVRV